MQGGLQLASDFMPQGDRLVIPLKRFIGYQQNTHVLVHFVNGSPDLGRKTFQPELRGLAEDLAVRATQTFVKYRWLFKPDTGETKELTPSKDLHIWKRKQEDWRDQNPLALNAVAPNATYLSRPRTEQDVVALFHQLVGAGVIKGLRFFATSQSERYDGLIELHYAADEHLYNAKTAPLGVRRDIEIPYESEPKVLEYKFDLSALLADFAE